MSRNSDAAQRGTARHVRGRELSSYIDGALQPRGAPRGDGHLEDCPGCLSELRSLRATKLTLAALPPGEPADGWLPGVEAGFRRGTHLSPSRSQRSRNSLRRRVALACAATVALAVAVWFAPPPPAPISFQDEVRQHLVQIGDPMTDQISYVVEARYP
ncbi:MAG: hypothetical protein NVSMB32_08250 [Actinomycetota bacterium]